MAGLLEVIQKIPVGLTILFVAIVAVFYTFGYFSSVGLEFLPLFALDEHIILAVTGLSWPILIYSAGYLLWSSNEFRKMFVLELRIRTFYLIILPIAAVAFLAAFIVSGWAYYGFQLAFLLVLFAEGSRSMAAVMLGHMNPHLVIALFSFIAATTAFGHLTGFDDLQGRNATEIALYDGSRGALVRMGQERTLLVRDNTLFVVPNEQILEIEKQLARRVFYSATPTE